MKKFRVVLAFVIIALLAMVFVACGENNGDNTKNLQPSEGLEYTLNEEGNYEYIVTDIGTCTDKNVVIPSEYNSRIVKGIGDNAFKDCTGIESITIPDSVKSIGSNAFEGCANLKSVTIGKGLTSISYGAFYSCKKLESIYYTGDLVGWCGISGLGYLMQKSVALYISGNKVQGDLIIPDGVTSIGWETFYGCSGLTSVTISNSVMSIGRDAFYGCSDLTSIVVPDSVTMVGKDAFCDTAWYNNQPDGVVYVGKVVYKYKGMMRNPSSIILENDTRSIVDYAFEYCNGMVSITIPNSVTSIGEKAFLSCVRLTSITYTGTMEQWNAIRKGNLWDYGVPWPCQVYCTDGTLSI